LILKEDLTLPRDFKLDFDLALFTDFRLLEDFKMRFEAVLRLLEFLDSLILTTRSKEGLLSELPNISNSMGLGNLWYKILR
jgi:hypothetical protein